MDTDLVHDGRRYTVVSIHPTTGEIHARRASSTARYQPRLYAFTPTGTYLGPVRRPDNRLQVRFPAPPESVEHELQVMLATLLQADPPSQLQPYARWVRDEYQGLLLSSLERENQCDAHPSLLQGVADVILLMRSSSSSSST